MYSHVGLCIAVQGYVYPCRAFYGHVGLSIVM